MTKLILVLALFASFSANAHDGCDGWGAYCSDFSGKGPSHPGVSLRMCRDRVLLVNGKEYFPVPGDVNSWASNDGNTYTSTFDGRNAHSIFAGPDGNWEGTCSTQD